ncbi:Mitochondrial translocator assembly and maintenance protein 41 [Coemansia erecta]|uniref:Phosphatidate cytidylyltransferase, mitochondrial n=1 Tax=Coemansia erecta TaxID=147472 RepID=A0A9W8CVZ7_9FUNG|nr:Mitochondrial translocator assembly and maintenance protein 41 [Coemansia erecta]
MNVLFVRGSKTLSAGAAKRVGAVSQIRWESKVAVDNDAEKSNGRATNESDAATILLMRKRDVQLNVESINDRQTVRPPAVHSGAQNIDETRTSKSSAGLKKTPSGGQASVGETLKGIPSLTAEEGIKLDEMRAAQDEIKNELNGVLRQFMAPIRYAFAYGSGVYKQAGYGTASKPMVDLIFAVSHPDHWHALNISQNRSHYSMMGALGSNAVSYVQERMGAGVYYNPYVEINGIVIKYGVVSMDTLSSDLLNWDTLYLAGRMHKPTLTLRRDPLMRISKQVNLTHAMRAALLMLPKNFSSQELFEAIASISFAGDFRMKVGGENPRKVQNIVEAQMPLFKSRYRSIIEGLPNLEYIGQDLLQQDMGPAARAAMLRKMPNNFYDQLVKQGRKSGVKLPPGLGAEAVNTERLASMPNISAISHKAVEKIVAWPAFTQSAKGILTSGVSKSIAYMRAKNEKYSKSK